MPPAIMKQPVSSSPLRAPVKAKPVLGVLGAAVVELLDPLPLVLLDWIPVNVPVNERRS